MPTYPEKIGEIVRRDTDFQNTGKPRIGGASFSSGVFVEQQTGVEWMGKGELHFDYAALTNKEPSTEGIACREKLANDIYAYYGANVPPVIMNNRCPSLMSKLVN